MTFKFIVMPQSLRIEFEAGSVGEGAAILEQEGTAIAEVFKACPWIETEQGVEVVPPQESEAPKTRKPRGSNKPKNQPDPATATAPPPMPVVPVPQPNMTGAAPTPSVPTQTLTIPAPVAPAPAMAVAPPPPAPAPAPVAPPAPPAPALDTTIPPFLKREVAKTLAPKVKAECEKRAAGAVDGGQALANWLADCGIVNKTNPPASFAEAMTVVELASDDQLAKVAEALGV